jgi:hypothetical protein
MLCVVDKSFEHELSQNCVLGNNQLHLSTLAFYLNTSRTNVSKEKNDSNYV